MKIGENQYETVWKKKSLDGDPGIEKGSRDHVALELLEVGDKLLDIASVCVLKLEKST